MSEEKCPYPKNKVKYNIYANNGMITKIWGPGLWTGLHSITFGYPIKPTPEEKEYYKNFFILVGYVLPCKYCRESYQKFISSGCSKLNDQALENRESLTRWLYYLHEEVNKKLCIDYGVTFEDIRNRYESYRAKCSHNTGATGCIIPMDLKAESYKKSFMKDAPVIPIEIIKYFIGYAKLRNLSDEILKMESLKQFYLKKDTNEWILRNEFCVDLIQKMRIEGLPSLEIDGEFKGLPTIDELKLILNFSSNLNRDELFNIIPKLPNKGNFKYYKLTK